MPGSVHICLRGGWTWKQSGVPVPCRSTCPPEGGRKVEGSGQHCSLLGVMVSG